MRSFIVIIILLIPAICWPLELKSRYTTILYKDRTQLKKLNDNLILGPLAYLLSNTRGITMTEELINKIDVIVEKVESILQMYPSRVRFTIVLLNTSEEVQEVYYQKYGKRVRYIAFYSPQDRRVYLSVKDAELAVLAHEIAHVIIDTYYDRATPVKIHEILADYVTRQFMP